MSIFNNRRGKRAGMLAPGYRYGADGLPTLERRHTPPPPTESSSRVFLIMLVVTICAFVAGFTLGCTLRSAQWVIDHVR
jgi:hypothetical protein